jgi:hypothetical protein
LIIKEINNYIIFEWIADRYNNGKYRFYEGKLDLICTKSRINVWK